VIFAAWRLWVFEAVDNAGDAVLDECHLKVDEQAEALVGQAEIGQELLLMDQSEQFYGLDFDDDFILDNQICAEPGVDTDVLVDHWDRMLAGYAETAAVEFIRQDGVINGFQQARAEGRMDAIGGVYYLSGNGVFLG
jgi:hypothetical protein